MAFQVDIQLALRNAFLRPHVFRCVHALTIGQIAGWTSLIEGFHMVALPSCSCRTRREDLDHHAAPKFCLPAVLPLPFIAVISDQT